MENHPIALTLGEPAGIGPELCHLAWEALRDDLTFFVLGEPRFFPADAPVELITDPQDAASAMERGLPVLKHEFAGSIKPGVPDPSNAQSVIDAIAKAVDLVQSGQASAVCTNPIHKKALVDGAGFAFPGHTEYLASLAGVERVVMMLAGPDLKVVPTTIHIALKDVPNALSQDLLRQTIQITHDALSDSFGIRFPRIAVCGLNPHAGEGGLMGTEDAELIAPVVEQLQDAGLDVFGPLSADTMFHKRARSTYDVAIAMYHDQALIPIKTLAFDEGVNVTLGLPFIRTSPDHGTALDIAGKGIARADSLIAALRLADQMAKARS